MDTTLFYLAIIVLAPMIASFLSVVIHRVPRGEGIVMGRSHCPACDHVLGPFELIPILGWLIFGGKCRHCKNPVPFRYLLLELLLPALLLLAAWLAGGPNLLFARNAIFIVLLVILSFIDLDTMELPHRFTLAGVASGLVFSLLGVGPPWQSALVGLGAGYLIPLLLSLSYKAFRGTAGMGGGDFVLLAMIGAHTGLPGVLVAFLAGVFSGSIVGLIMMSRMRRGKMGQLAIPFGPYLALGGLVAVFWGPVIVDTYLRISGLR